MQHSKIVGGSTAKRVIACPGSVALVDTVPPKPSSSYADEGTLLHDTIADVLLKDADPSSFIGRKHQDIELTQDLIDDKLLPALRALDAVDPKAEMEYEETIADINRKLAGVETILLFTEPELTCISSTIVRELLQYGKDIGRFLPDGMKI